MKALFFSGLLPLAVLVCILVFGYGFLATYAHYGIERLKNQEVARLSVLESFTFCFRIFILWGASLILVSYVAMLVAMGGLSGFFVEAAADQTSTSLIIRSVTKLIALGLLVASVLLLGLSTFVLWTQTAPNHNELRTDEAPSNRRQLAPLGPIRWLVGTSLAGTVLLVFPF